MSFDEYPEHAFTSEKEIFFAKCLQLVNFGQKDSFEVDVERADRVRELSGSIKNLFEQSGIQVSEVASTLFSRGMDRNDIARIIYILRPDLDKGQLTGVMDIAQGR